MHINNLIKHLYFENDKTSKEYSLNRCLKILENIAKAKDRVSNLQKFDDEYSREKILSLEISIKRLENYYNTCISSLAKF